MTRRCEQCGEEFEAQRRTKRFCSSSCRAYSSQGKPPQKVVDLPKPPTGSGTSVASVTRVKLQAAGVLETPGGRATMLLAEQMDARQDRGSALAALVKEFRATLAEALKDATVAADPVDELKAKREARLRGAG